MILPTGGAECPHCGKKAALYNENEYKYGSPIVQCSGCGKKYIDKRFHEIAIEGMPTGLMNTARYARFALIGVVLSIVSLAVSFVMYKAFGRVDLRVAIFCPLFIIVSLFNVIELIKVKTGMKSKELEKQMEESKKRLQDPVYVAELEENGYTLPKQ